MEVHQSLSTASGNQRRHPDAQKRTHEEGGQIMVRLAQVPPLMKTEALPNYLSRLAAVNGASSLQKFRRHFALPTNLSYASQDLFSKVGRLTGISQSDLESNILFAVTGHDDLGHTKLRWTNIHTASARYCPLCVADDSIGSRDNEARPWVRGAWHALNNYVCIEHSTPLYASPIPYDGANRWDFSKHVRDNQHELKTAIAEARQSEVRAYDVYFAGRLTRTNAEVRYLDPVPYHIAYQLCGVVGQMKLSGASEVARAQSGIMHDAYCLGFDILSDEGKLTAFLCEQDDRHLTRTKSSSRYRVYGPLQRYLTYLSDLPGARPLTDFVREHAMNALPIGPTDDFIGGGGVRRWHTLRTAKLEFNIDTRLARKMLVERGVLCESQATLKDNDILIPAAEIETLVGVRDDGVYLQYIKDKFGVVDATAQQLIHLGVIQPLYGAVSGIKTKFSQTAIDAILDVACRNVSEQPEDGSLLPLVDATRVGARSIANLIAAVVAGRLRARALST
ncbi:MAG: hypothetical protein EOO38_08375, partial [Cytophagaceae bacterium]